MPSSVVTRRSLAAAALLVGSVAGILIVGHSTSSAQTTTTSTSSTTSTSTTTTTPGTTTTTVLPTTTTTAKPKPKPKPPREPKLVIGDQGPYVRVVQQRLAALGYWLGPINGIFADSTQQAVYALQKAADLQRDGVVGPATYAALARGVRPTIRPANGNLIEINLGEDLLMIVRHGGLFETLNTSTGGGYTYYDGGVESVAITPTGFFHIYRQVNGLVIDTLGELWRPKYFDSGFAIHGDSYVPSIPVSHGCVRVSNEAIDWIWANNLIPLGTEVWIFN